MALENLTFFKTLVLIWLIGVRGFGKGQRRPTKVRLVKAMVLPVVVYGCESWTIKTVQS